MSSCILQSIKQFLAPPRLQGREEGRKAIVLHYIALMSILSLIFFITAGLLAPPVMPRMLFAMAVNVIVGLSTLIINKRGDFRTASLWFLFVHYFELILITWIAGGVFATSLLFTMIIIFWMGFLLSHRIQNVATVGTIIIGYIYAYLMTKDYVSALNLSHSVLSYWTLIVYNITVLAVTQHIIMYEMQRDRRQLELEAFRRLRAEQRQRDIRNKMQLLVADRSRDLREEQKALSELERLASIKEDFLVNLSHELLKPLSAIADWLDILTKADCDPHNRAAGLSAVQQAALHEKQLIEDLIDMPQFTQDIFSIHAEEMVLSSVVQEAIAILLPSAKRRNNHIILEVTGNNDTIWGDRNRIRQVFWNLLSNSVKFSHENGEIFVRIWSDNGNVVASVKDDGVGIDPVHLPHIFDRYVHARASGPLAAPMGLGLGLAVTRHIVELHHGAIEVSSPGLQRGACFTVKFRKAPYRGLQSAVQKPLR